MLTVVPARKLGMTSVFDGGGTTMPATVVEPYDLYVIRKKTAAKDGYSAIVFGFDESTDKHINKPKKGQLDKAGIAIPLRKSFEIRINETDFSEYEIGKKVKPEDFLYLWGTVNVTAVSKGKGFQGVMRRHNFRGVKMTHGHTIHRKPASGGATDPARQLKGSRRPGHMGSERVTIKGLTVFEYDRLHNIIVIHGNVPGPKGGMVWVKLAKELEKEIVESQNEAYLAAKAMEDQIESTNLSVTSTSTKEQAVATKPSETADAPDASGQTDEIGTEPIVEVKDNE
jgi:large subunit ribosomal protein L3